MTRARILIFAAAALTVSQAHESACPNSAFVGTCGTDFVVNGKAFEFIGTNNYYLMYQDPFMVEDVFMRAAAANLSVLRTWTFIDIGHPDGSGSIDDIKNGIWFQAFDPTTQTVVINATNLAKLDYVVSVAKQYGVRLLMTFTNNWRDFGGVDQYVRWASWANSSYTNPQHDDFFTDPFMRQHYKAWVTALVNRVNTYTGVAYKDEQTIFGWELMNEPRCQGSGDYPSSNNCTTNYAVYGKWPVAWKIGGWVQEMSAFVKSVDPNHMVAVGDEGFLCESYQTCGDTTCDCYFGTDFYNFTALPNIAFGSAHLYPNNWGHDANWGAQWITNHTAMAHQLGKPMLVGEFGYPSSGQDAVYSQWIAAGNAAGTNGLNFWMLCGRQDQGGQNGWYPNYDGFCVYFANATDPAPPSGDPATPSVLAAAAAARARA